MWRCAAVTRGVKSAPLFRLPNRTISSFPALPLFQSAVSNSDRHAVFDGNRAFRYSHLLGHTRQVSQELEKNGVSTGLRVGLLTPPGYEYCVGISSIWALGAVAVPVSPAHPLPEMEHVLGDSGSKHLLVHPSLYNMVAPLCQEKGITCISLVPFDGNSAAPPGLILAQAAKSLPALMIYTSGTTGKPKGVTHTHASLGNQVAVLQDSWGWSNSDHILSILPLHHIHGIANVVLSALHSGASVEFMGAGAPALVNRFLSPPSGHPRPTLFMAVPTVYTKLLQHAPTLPQADQQRLREAFVALRLMVSGSSALPEPIKEAFSKLSGHTLLERYGMTETGMILSQPLNGPRPAGTVGIPLPTVDCRLEPIPDMDVPPEDAALYDEIGELLVRSPSLFLHYHGNPKATTESFSKDGYFCTGDVVGKLKAAPRHYKILGRRSADIIKMAGYKISALDIEDCILRNPDIAEAAVLGVPDETYGQRIGALVVPAANRSVTPDAVREWCQKHLAGYKVPKDVLVLSEIPRNALGKVNKKSLIHMFAKPK